jgi:signal transduction histidine kinase
MLWLGLTVLLNAERRTWGLWLTGSGLLMGGLFFMSHTAVIGLSLDGTWTGMFFWLAVAWIPLVSLPYAWYVVILWYSAFWEDRRSPIHRRQLPGLYVTTVLALLTVGLLLVANPLPPFSLSQWIAPLVRLDLANIPQIGNLPPFVLVYPLYLLVCQGLALDALRRPGEPTRLMGHLARRRARPWLVAATLALLLVSLLVGWAMVWIIQTARRGIYDSASTVLGEFDLVIQAIIAASIVMIGQAVVSYEVFTGKTLPRHGLRRYWQRALILAAGYGLVVGWALVYPLRPVYTVLLSTAIMTIFYALLSWRSYAEREQHIENLRPFVSSQGLYEQLLFPASTPSAATGKARTEIASPFHALCTDLLGARLAYLIPLGPLGPLAGPGLAYPETSALPDISALLLQLQAPQALFLPLDPAAYQGAAWAIPLWSERGLIGALLLGEKRAGSLYTQEEIELARAAGERLIDAQASTEMARRLMALQRQHLAQSQVIDQRARRVLHDDVLPRLHTTLLALSSAEAGQEEAPLPQQEGAPLPLGEAPLPLGEALKSLAETHRQVAALLRDLPTVSAPEVARLGLAGALRQMVDEELAAAFDQVDWQIEPQAAERAAAIPPLTAEVLFYAAREAVRNAARHARPPDSPAPLHLRIALAWENGLRITVQDDGVGFSESGAGAGSSGQGLALHSTLMAVVGGSLSVESVPGKWTRVTLQLPMEGERPK